MNSGESASCENESDGQRPAESDRQSGRNLRSLVLVLRVPGECRAGERIEQLA